jgi:hypothetical protein
LFSRERSSNLPKRSITGPSQFPFFFVLMLPGLADQYKVDPP